MKYDMTIAPFNYIKKSSLSYGKVYKWFFDGQVTYLRKRV